MDQQPVKNAEDNIPPELPPLFDSGDLRDSFSGTVLPESSVEAGIHHMDGDPDNLRTLPRLGVAWQHDVPEYSETAALMYQVEEDEDWGERLSITDVEGSTPEVNTWNEIEVKLFIISLYVFECDLEMSSLFLETKNTVDCQDYYEGDFYQHPCRERWEAALSEIGAAVEDSKMYATGSHLLAKRRLKELVKRIEKLADDKDLPLFFQAIKELEESQDSLQGTERERRHCWKANKCAVKFMLCLKRMIGEPALIEVFCMGEEHDLTNFKMVPYDQREARSGIRNPSRQACAGLSTHKIFTLLIFKRSSQSKNLPFFWDAIWPRLKQRGWSEGEKLEAMVAKSTAKAGEAAYPTESLIFIVPGGAETSEERRGIDYFDSIDSVLCFVASNPECLHGTVSRVEWASCGKNSVKSKIQAVGATIPAKGKKTETGRKGVEKAAGDRKAGSKPERRAADRSRRDRQAAAVQTEAGSKPGQKLQANLSSAFKKLADSVGQIFKKNGGNADNVWEPAPVPCQEIVDGAAAGVLKKSGGSDLKPLNGGLVESRRSLRLLGKRGLTDSKPLSAAGRVLHACTSLGKSLKGHQQEKRERETEMEVKKEVVVALAKPSLFSQPGTSSGKDGLGPSECKRAQVESPMGEKEVASAALLMGAEQPAGGHALASKEGDGTTNTLVDNLEKVGSDANADLEGAADTLENVLFVGNEGPAEAETMACVEKLSDISRIEILVMVEELHCGEDMKNESPVAVKYSANNNVCNVIEDSGKSNLEPANGVHDAVSDAGKEVEATALSDMNASLESGKSGSDFVTEPKNEVIEVKEMAEAGIPGEDSHAAEILQPVARVEVQVEEQQQGDTTILDNNGMSNPKSATEVKVQRELKPASPGDMSPDLGRGKIALFSCTQVVEIGMAGKERNKIDLVSTERAAEAKRVTRFSLQKVAMAEKKDSEQKMAMVTRNAVSKRKRDGRQSRKAKKSKTGFREAVKRTVGKIISRVAMQRPPRSAIKKSRRLLGKTPLRVDLREAEKKGAGKKSRQRSSDVPMSLAAKAADISGRKRPRVEAEPCEEDSKSPASLNCFPLSWSGKRQRSRKSPPANTVSTAEGSTVLPNNGENGDSVLDDKDCVKVGVIEIGNG